MLNTSALNDTSAASFTLKFFSRPKSNSTIAGPMIVFLPTFPYVPAIGSEKAHGSNQCAGVPTGVPAANPVHPTDFPWFGLLLNPGFKFGRSASPAVDKFLEFAVARSGVIGCPASYVPM